MSKTVSNSKKPKSIREGAFCVMLRVMPPVPDLRVLDHEEAECCDTTTFCPPNSSILAK
ncbi:hypothetical protein [Cohnella fermenti]|uniref:hypothetical protein n=1 Tax=Cohnella fermenti TaxID=2565925 RepID=UPI001454DAAC|nr:hypothetical protein [Cohnella fermenti]